MQVQAGVAKAKQSGLGIAASWGSKERRTKHDKNGGGLYYSTYAATLRRQGVYVSGCAGEIDLNQELADPVLLHSPADVLVLVLMAQLLLLSALAFCCWC